METCPNCNTPIKTSMFSSVELYNKVTARLINAYQTSQAEGYCTKCGEKLLAAAQQKAIEEREQLTREIATMLDAIPVVSIPHPLGWDYEVIGIVTGQSTTGTGVFSELSASVNDIFGTKSGRFNKKIKAGEALCTAQLRQQTLDLGGHAVLGTDIDYSEVGGERGMLMVCMAGTAVRLKNLNILGAEKAGEMKHLQQIYTRLKFLRQFDLTH